MSIIPHTPEAEALSMEFTLKVVTRLGTTIKGVLAQLDKCDDESQEKSLIVVLDDAVNKVCIETVNEMPIEFIKQQFANETKQNVARSIIDKVLILAARGISPNVFLDALESAGPEQVEQSRAEARR